jgi:hypothetical protein
MAKDTKYFILITLGNAYMKLKDFPNAYKYHADAFMLIKCRQGTVGPIAEKSPKHE